LERQEASREKGKKTPDPFSRLRKAAAEGNVGAMYHLGGMYADGRGVPRDGAKAVEWLRKAASKGHVGAQELLKEVGLDW